MELQLGRAGIAAVEAHERIRQLVIEFSSDVLLEDLLRHGVVDVEERDGVARDDLADELGQCPVDIDLAGDRDALARQTAVDVAGNEFEHRLESGPALRRQRDVLSIALVRLDPVLQRQLILGQPRQDLRLLVAASEILLHILHHIRDPLVALMVQEGLIQIELGVLLDLYAQIVKLLDRRIAREEILRARTEGNDLQILKCIDRPRHRKEVVDHVRALLRVAHRVLRNIRLHVAELQVVARVQHAAVGVAAVARKDGDVLLRRRAEHLRSVEVLRKQRLGDLRPEVAEVDAERVAVMSLDVGQRVDHVDLALDDGDRTLVDILRVILFRIGLHERLSSRLRKRSREAVAAHADDADFDFRCIIHLILSFERITFINMFYIT